MYPRNARRQDIDPVSFCIIVLCMSVRIYGSAIHESSPSDINVRAVCVCVCVCVCVHVCVCVCVHVCVCWGGGGGGGALLW